MHQHGQALVELAVFGSFLILLLGTLINYGLNADFRQQAMMEAFRTALGVAGEPTDPADPNSRRGAATVVLVHDREIPNPSHPFALGSVVPIVVAENVTRNPRLDFTPTFPHVEELPRVRLTVDGQPVDCPSAGMGCTTAGFRAETVPAGSLKRYREIYGADQIAPQANGTSVILDACEGEIINYEGCRQQAKRITDSRLCTTSCKKARRLLNNRNSTPCSTICAEPMNRPWYAADGVLDRLFAGVRSTGLQQDFADRTNMNTLLIKRENGAQIVTTDRVDWQEDTNRELIFKQLQNTDPRQTLLRTPVSRRAVDEHRQKSWSN